VYKGIFYDPYQTLIKKILKTMLIYIVSLKYTDIINAEKTASSNTDKKGYTHGISREGF
jgi:hypothetical protein